MSDTLSLVVIDSGLGGLSVVADLAKQLAKSSPKPIANLTFYNAWPSLTTPYNVMPSLACKTRVFSDALDGTYAFSPDNVLIACNTLSVLYHDTDFAKTTETKVSGIIEFGVDTILEKLNSTPQSKIVIAATPTTIEAATHKEALIKAGIAEERIITQDYGRLAEKIEKDPDSQEVCQMIEQYTEQAKAKLSADDKSTIFAALCCTHYGYSMNAFQGSLDKCFNQHVEILNPNQAMSAGSIPETETMQQDVTLNIRVVSKVAIEQDKIDAIGKIISNISPETCLALNKYELNENLFEFNYSHIEQG